MAVPKGVKGHDRKLHAAGMDLLALPETKRRSASALHPRKPLFSEAETLNLNSLVHSAVSVAKAGLCCSSQDILHELGVPHTPVSPRRQGDGCTPDCQLQSRIKKIDIPASTCWPGTCQCMITAGLAAQVCNNNMQ